MEYTIPNGGMNLYHPGYDYNKPEKAAVAAVNEAKRNWDFSAYGYASLSLMALADDVTGVGVIDDVVIPAAYAAATFKFAYDNQYLIEKQAREIAHWTQKNLSLKNGFVYELQARTSVYYPDI